jgi:hypothetical protein
MTTAELLDFVTLHLPDNIGVLLAGSQRHKKVFSNSTDIDVVILTPSFSHTQTFFLHHGAYKLDFIAVPFTDIENVMWNEANSTNGGVLHMLFSGVVLKDTYELFPVLQEKAGYYSSRIGGRVFADYQQNTRDLARNIKHFAKPLNTGKKIMLLCDVVSRITELESIKASNWASKTHKLSLFDAEQNNSICAELITLFNEAVHTNNSEAIFNFADYYLKTAASLLSYPISATTRLLIDLDYPDFSLPHFMEHVLPAIKKNERFNNCFSNFYLSPRHYYKTYQNRITLVFKISGHTQAGALVKELEATFSEAFGTGKRYSVIYQSNDQFTFESFALLEELRIAMNEFICKKLTANEYGPDQLMHDSICLGSFIGETLHLSIKDISKANSFLAQRAFMSPEEQGKLYGFNSLKQTLEAKLQFVSSFYHQYSKQLTSYCEQGISMALHDVEKVSNSYAAIQNAVENILNDESYFSDTDNNLCFLALKHSQCEDVDGAFKYVTVMSEILQYIGMTEPGKFICLLALSKTMAVLQIPATNPSSGIADGVKPP